jgi:PhoPQ-activated pathogenicity-related protein
LPQAAGADKVKYSDEIVPYWRWLMNLRPGVAALGLVFLCGTAGQGFEPAMTRTPLDEYVARPDAAYSWKVVGTTRGDGYTAFLVDLRSQNWRKVPQVDRTAWDHRLIVVKPDVVKYDTAFLTIGGGSNQKPPRDRPGENTLAFALQSNTVVAELGMVPNQPLTFDGDGQARVEDDLIAYCWNRFMDTADSTWLPRLPMVKSAVRAMDAVTELMNSEQGGRTAVKSFVIAGGSKRGWTTWLTGAVDRRVVAIVPIVIDVVNVRACSEHHFCAYGFWAPAIGDYTRHKIQERKDNPRYDELLKIVDPYSYRERLTLPKFIVNASGDQYFPPDSSRFYFDDLKGPKYLRYVPNADHSLKGTDASESILAFYQAVLAGSALPRFSWKAQADGSLRIRTNHRPSEVCLWQATNPKARDFRLESIGPVYKKTPLKPQEEGVYTANVERPGEGWTAYFVELTFPGPAKAPLKFTTPVQIVPDILPHRIEELDRGRKGG